ncbi:MAG: adenosine deaminase [Anaerolineaceae bacterium]|nr:adenosine deaminase [Anaerolineaceae bacterium]
MPSLPVVSELNPLAFFAPDALPELRQLPKCNIHTHLEGSIRPATLAELAIEQGIALPVPADQVASLLQIDGNEQSLADYLDKISITYPLLKNEEALHRAAFEAAEDAALDGVVYFEMRVGPVTHSGPCRPVEAVLESILAGLKQAESQYDITCGLIVSGLRNHDPLLNVKLAQAAVSFRDTGVVGFDLAGDEDYPAQEHAEAFKMARSGGLGITVHAGEAGGPENVRYAVEELGATRIGHGVHSSRSPEVLKLLRDRRVLLEICPTSNVHTHCIADIQQHPIRQFYLQGIPISVGDDDPITSRTRVSNELTLLHNDLGFSFAELQDIQIITMRSAFLQNTTAVQSIQDKINRFQFVG